MTSGRSWFYNYFKAYLIESLEDNRKFRMLQHDFKYGTDGEWVITASQVLWKGHNGVLISTTHTILASHSFRPP